MLAATKQRNPQCPTVCHKRQAEKQKSKSEPKVCTWNSSFAQKRRIRRVSVPSRQSKTSKIHNDMDITSMTYAHHKHCKYSPAGFEPHATTGSARRQANICQRHERSHPFKKLRICYACQKRHLCLWQGDPHGTEAEAYSQIATHRVVSCVNKLQHYLIHLSSIISDCQVLSAKCRSKPNNLPKLSLTRPTDRSCWEHNRANTISTPKKMDGAKHLLCGGDTFATVKPESVAIVKATSRICLD